MDLRELMQLTSEMQKNQNARHHMKIDVNVAMIFSTCCVIAGSPKYVIPVGKSFAKPIIDKDVKAGGPLAVRQRSNFHQTETL